MSPEEMKDEIDGLNNMYEALQKKKDELTEKYGDNVFRRRLNFYDRQMMKLNREIAGKITKLSQIGEGNFKTPESTQLG